MKFVFANLLLVQSTFAAAFTVTLSNVKFTPPSLTVNVGDTVTWRDTEGFHDTVSGSAGVPDGVWNSNNQYHRLMFPDDTFSFTFTRPGTYPYYCTPHWSLGMVGSFATLAKRLAPSLIVLEDVDLVAQERSFGPFGSSPVLFELMDQMSGLGDDADVAFVLTTNRADALEPALAARPGRVDLAIEIPLPDVVARRKLVELYAIGLDIGSVDLDRVVERTAGVTASFIRELLRRAALLAADQGRTQVTEEDVHAALDELLRTTSALTRSLLGVPGDDRENSDRLAQHGWLQAFPDNL